MTGVVLAYEKACDLAVGMRRDDMDDWRAIEDERPGYGDWCFVVQKHTEDPDHGITAVDVACYMQIPLGPIANINRGHANRGEFRCGGTAYTTVSHWMPIRFPTHPNAKNRNMKGA